MQAAPTLYNTSPPAERQSAPAPAPVERPLRAIVPFTDRVRHGVVELMPVRRLLAPLPLVMVSATLAEKLVDEAMLKDLFVELYPMVHALTSEANWKLASPVPELSPKVARPVLATLKSVVVAVPLVVDAMAKSGVFTAVVAELEMESNAYGDVVPTPNRPVEERNMVEVAWALPASLPTRKLPLTREAERLLEVAAQTGVLPLHMSTCPFVPVP